MVKRVFSVSWGMRSHKAACSAPQSLQLPGDQATVACGKVSNTNRGDKFGWL